MVFIRGILAFCVFLFSVSQTHAQTEKIQSGIFYYFTTYIEWPPAKSTGDFVITVVGNDPIVSHLKDMAKAKRVGSRPIVVKQSSTIQAASESHIIFLGNDKLSQFSTALAVAASKNILLVTDMDGYGEKGAGINFFIKNGKPAYQINNGAIASCGLKSSSKLTSLGTEIN